jgi:hypothetical protein
MVDPGSAVPVRVRAPVLDGDGIGEIVGVTGRMVSTEKVVFLGEETLFAVSVRVVVIVDDPCGRAGETVAEKVPEAETVPEARTVPEAFLIWKVEPGSPVPEMVGVVVATADPEVGSVMTGVDGAVVSMTNAVLAVLQFRAVSQEARVSVVLLAGAGLSGQQE